MSSAKSDLALQIPDWSSIKPMSPGESKKWHDWVTPNIHQECHQCSGQQKPWFRFRFYRNPKVSVSTETQIEQKPKPKPKF